MKKKMKILFVLLLAIVITLSFTPSYTSFSIDNLAFVIAIGIDVGETNNLKVSFQFNKPSVNISESSSSSEENSTFINTVEASSIDTAINLMNAFVGRQINLSHCKLIIFSEKFAYSGISKEIFALDNNVQVRPSTNILISKCEAKTYLEHAKPSIESLTSKYYEIFPNSSKYTGYTYNATLSDFVDNLVCDSCQPFAILGNLTSSDKNNEGSNVSSGETSVIAERQTENICIAVFKKDYLVGELTANETICFSTIKNAVNGFLITIQDPDDNSNYLDIYITPKAKPKAYIDISSGFPYIKLSGTFKGKIFSLDYDNNYVDANRLEAISNATNDYLENMFTEYLYKTSVELRSDINGFGKSCLKNFLTVTDMQEYDWLNVYENSTFSVNFDTNIESGLLYLKT